MNHPAQTLGLVTIVVSDYDEAIAFFLHADDVWRHFSRYQRNGVVIVRAPKLEPCGTVAVFRDACGDLWDRLQPVTSAA